MMGDLVHRMGLENVNRSLVRLGDLLGLGWELLRGLMRFDDFW